MERCEAGCEAVNTIGVRRGVRREGRYCIEC